MCTIHEISPCKMLYTVIRYVWKKKEIIIMKMKRPQTHGGVQEEDHINLKEQKIFNLILFMLLYELFSLLFFFLGQGHGRICVFFYKTLSLKELFSYQRLCIFFLSFWHFPHWWGLWLVKMFFVCVVISYVIVWCFCMMKRSKYDVVICLNG